MANSESPDAEADARQRILLVTGMLGAGKTTALRELEDLGWEAIDNFPIRLLDRLIDPETDKKSDIGAPLAIGFDSRTRGFDPARIIDEVKLLSRRKELLVTTLFLDCADQELERRYNETRHRHPLANGVPATDGIGAERELLEPLRRWADMVINTSTFSANQLQQAIREQFGGLAGGRMSVTVSSFGFARGMPPVADLVFDMRYLDNPHWQEEPRELTGLDEAVAEHIRADPAFESTVPRIRDLLLELIPRYATQGRSYVNIAFGCTGGRHRSVFVAEEIARALRNEGFSPTVRHRNLGSRAAELIEGPQQS
jgi:UPF0042 nucleotide-binding protein